MQQLLLTARRLSAAGGRPLAYALAALLTSATLLLRLATGISVGQAPILILFTFPIILSAYIGGLGPGLAATALAAILTNYVLLPPYYAFSIATALNLVQSGSLIAAGALISALVEALHRARRRAEAERQLQAVTLASIGDAVITTDARARISFLNHEAERLTGWTDAAAAGRPLAEVFRIVNAQTRAPAEDPAAKVLRSGKVIGLANHTVLIGRDGRETPIDDSAAPIRQAGGATAGVVLVFRDVAERERAEQELRRQQETLREQAQLLDHAHVLIRDLDGRITLWNAGAEELYGWTKAEALGQVTHTFFQTKFPESFAAYQAQLLGQGSWEGELIHTRRDGARLYVASHQVLHRNQSGAPIAILEVNNDITARRQAEAALSESEERLRTVTDTAQVGLVIVDQQHRYRYANRAYAEMFRLPTADIVGQRVADVLAPVYEAQIRPRLERAFGGERVSYELVVAPSAPDMLERYYAVTYEPGMYRSQAVVIVVVVEITERKQAEQALRERESKLSALLELLPVGISILDANRTISYNNPALAKILELSDADLHSNTYGMRTYLDATGNPMPADGFASARALKENHAVHNVETGIVKGDGSLIWTNVSAVPVDFPDWKVVVVTFDITARKQAEIALRQSEERFATAFRASPAAKLIIRASDGRFIDVNDSYLRLFGYTRDELIGQIGVTANIYTSPEQRADIVRLLREQGSVQNLELVLRAKSGELRTALCSLVQIELDGEACLLGSMVDITDRKQAEQALRQSEERFAKAFRSTPAALAISRLRDSHFIDVNESFLGLFGYARDEVIERSAFELNLFPNLDEIAAIGRLVREQGTLHNRETTVRTKSGELRHVLFSSEAIEVGGEACFLTIQYDITDRKRAEQALQRSAVRLQVLADASRAFAEAGAEYQRLLDQIAQIAARQLAAGCIVRLLSDDAQWLETAALYLEDPALQEVAQTLLGRVRMDADDPNPHIAVVRSGKPLLIPAIDLQAVRSSLSPELWRATQHLRPRTTISTPLRIQGRVIGILSLTRFGPEQPSFTEDDLTLAQDLADRAALAISNARLLVQVRRSAERLGHLHTLDQAMLAERPLAEIAEAAVADIGQLIPTIRAGVVLYNAESQTVTALALQVHGVMQTPTGTDLPLAVFGAAVETLLQGQVYQVADAAALPEQPPFMRTAQAEQVRAYFQVPIMAGDELIALLSVGADAPNAFSPEHVEIAREVADQLSIAIQQARLRAQLAQHAQELEARVAARTAELAAANRELEAFSYSVSHDLRAPLRAIDGFSRILQEGYVAGLPEDARRYFQLVRDNAQQMGRLIDDLLAFSRLSRQPLSKRAVDVGALVRQCLADLGGEQDGRRIEIAVGELPECAADPALLKQVWINLLSNALKYTRLRDPARIEIGSRIADETLIYYVKDNGVGFDMRYSDKLFGVFQRLHRAEDYEGTGVGLAIVQRIVQRHGGRVWAEAEIDRGAVFFFTVGGEAP